MIVGKDTLPLKLKMDITIDTIRKGEIINTKADTSYEYPCWRFEKIKGKIVNRTDSNCLQQGLWITNDSLGNYSTSFYIDGDDDEKWTDYNKNGKLLRESQAARLGNQYFIVKQIDYSSGKPRIIVNVPFFRFYINNFPVIVPLLVLLMLIRIVINNRIYNIENQTNFSIFGNRFIFKSLEPDEFRHVLLRSFTIWFFKYKPENRHLVIISNILSILCFGSFAIYTIGPMMCR